MSRLPGWNWARSRWVNFLLWTSSIEGIMTWGPCLPSLRRRLARRPLKDFRQVKRVTLLRYDRMCDMVHTSGMLRELRRLLPKADITLVCRTPWASWMRTCPWVDRVVDIELKFPARFYQQRRLAALLSFARREIWPRDPELLLQPGTLYWYFESRALAWFTGAPARFCWEDPDWDVDTGGRFHTHALPLAQSLHETEKCFRMLEAIGLSPSGRKLDTWWTDADAQQAGEMASRARGGRRQLVMLGVASSETPKMWPQERYLKLVREVARQRPDVAFMTIGGKDVAPTGDWLVAQEPGLVHNACGQLGLGAVWALTALCDLYVGNDTGILHMAAAARTPVVMICGMPLTARPGTRGDPRHTGPHDTVSRIIYPPPETPADTPVNASLVPCAPVVAATLELLALSARA